MRPSISVTHDGLTYTFDILHDNIAQYRFVYTVTRGPNSERTSQIDFEDIPEPVLNEIRAEGYTPR